MKHPSSSNAEAFAMCGASHVYPQSDAHSDAMYRGTEGHEPLAAIINGRPASATKRGLDLVKSFPLAEVLSGVTSPQAEVAYVVNVKTRAVREVGVDIGRNYGALERYDVPTTLDVQGYKSGRRWIRDWKFGRTSSPWQLLIQGMAVAFPHALPEVDAGFIYIDGTTGGREYEEDPRVLSLEELDEAADKLVLAWDRVEAMEAALKRGEAIAVTEGAWCTFCGAYPYCPAKTNLVRHLVDEFQADGAIGALTIEQCGVAWAKLQEIRRLSERMYDALKGRAAAEPLPLPNGKRLVMVDVPGRAYFDTKSTRDLLAEHGASEEQIGRVLKKGAGYQQAKEMK